MRMPTVVKLLPNEQLGTLGSRLESVEVMVDKCTRTTGEVTRESLRQELGPWYYVCGLGYPLWSPGWIAYLFACVASFAFLGYFSFLSALSAALIFSEDISYSCFMMYAALTGLWSSVINLTLFFGRPAFLRAFLCLSIHFFSYDHETDIESGKFLAMKKKMQKSFIFLPILLSFFMILMIFLIPLNAKPTQNFETTLLVPAYCPFTISSKEMSIIYSGLQMLFMAIIIILMNTGLYIFLTLSLHWIYQMLRLTDSIRSLNVRATRLFRKRFPIYSSEVSRKKTFQEVCRDESFVNCYVDCLIENIKHHHVIKRYEVDVKSCVGFCMGLMLLLSSLSLALLIQIILDGAILTPSVLLGASLFALLACSHMGQQTVDMEDDLRQAIFETDWPFLHRKVIYIIKILLEVTKVPKRPRLYGFLYYDREAFVTMVKAAATYYNFLMLTAELAGSVRRRKEGLG